MTRQIVRLLTTLSVLLPALSSAHEVNRILDKSLIEIAGRSIILSQTNKGVLSVRVLFVPSYDDCNPTNPTPTACGMGKLYVAVSTSDALTIGDLPGEALYEIGDAISWQFREWLNFASTDEKGRFTSFAVTDETIVPVNDKFELKHHKFKISVNTRMILIEPEV
jgi:hypothetical protein